MPLIALGWCRADVLLPDPLMARGDGPVVVLCAEERIACGAADRLRLLQAAFDAGVDSVPLSPDRLWPLALARKLASDCCANLVGQLAVVSGAGQLCVSALCTDVLPTESAAASGRDWLQRLQARHRDREERAIAVRSALSRLVSDLPVPQTIIRPSASGCGVTLLVARTAFAEVSRQIIGAGRNLDAPAGMTVTVSGLWPALDFVRLPTRTVEVPA